MQKTRAIRGRSSSASVSAETTDRTERSKLQRRRDRGSHDWDVIFGIVDEAFIAHVGFCIEEQMFVIPTMYGRDGNTCYPVQHSIIQ